MTTADVVTLIVAPTILAIAAGVALIMRKLGLTVSVRRDASRPPPPPSTGREVTGSFVIGPSSSEDIRQTREMVLQLLVATSDDARERVQDQISRELIARIHELAEQQYVAIQRMASEQRTVTRDLRGVQDGLRGVQGEVRRVIERIDDGDAE